MARMPANAAPTKAPARKPGLQPSTGKATASSSAVDDQLAKYRSMRDFGITAEPSGETKTGKAAGLPFVIQKHAATRLHYDFRLGWNGVLKSWAVAKGPSYVTRDKRLAVETEDHPVEYGGFEGTIPKGQYGGGTVMVWDTGTWEPQPEHDFNEGLARGNLKFILHGKKLQGKWALIRMGGKFATESKPNWLLIKEHDQYERSASDPCITDQAPDSAVTGRSLEEIAAASDHVWQSNGHPGSGGSESVSPARSKESAMRDRLRAKFSGSAKQPAAESPEPAKSAPPATRTASAAKSSRSVSGKKSSARKSKTTSAPKPDDPEPAASPTANDTVFLDPQLAVQADAPPSGDAWVHELKLDGYRIQAHVRSGRAGTSLYTRSGLDWTHRMAAVRDALSAQVHTSAVLDGEVVVLDAEGQPSFAQLQAAFQDHIRAQLTYYVFDLLMLDGNDLRRLPLIERKARLQELLRDAPPQTLRYSEHIRGHGGEMFDRACSMGAEGIISKREDSLYLGGRHPAWVKSKCIRRQEFVIGAFTPASKGNRGLGALLLGYYGDAGELVYAGRTGTGFTHDSAARIRAQLERIGAPKSPFASLPAGAGKDAHWVQPEMVCEVAFATWTADNLVRQASFQGLREDKPAREVRKEDALPVRKVEKAAAVEAAEISSDGSRENDSPDMLRTSGAPALVAAAAGSNAGQNDPAALRARAIANAIRLTNPDKILDRDSGLTKRQLLDYLAAAGENILPHIRNRPLTLVRCPDGTGHPCFYQKHIGKGLPAGIVAIPIQDKSSKEPEDYLMLDSLPALAGLAQMGVLELHPWGSHADTLEQPDRLIFDLDPDEALPWNVLADAAEEVRERLKAMQLTSFVKSTGGKGLHVVAPLLPQLQWPDFKTLAHAFVTGMERKNPKLYLTKMTRAARVGKIYLDYLRNERGATAVSAFSPRARAGAPVAVTLDWAEIHMLKGPPRYRVVDFAEWKHRLATDPWLAMPSVHQSLTVEALQQLHA